jgi:hypothetical protein
LPAISFFGPACSFGLLCRRPSAGRALFQGIPQIDGNAVLLHQVGEGLVRQFLKRRHAVARQLLQLGKRVVVKFD